MRWLETGACWAYNDRTDGVAKEICEIGGNRITIFYFTATGNSLAVAKRIGGTLVSIPQVIDSDGLHCKDDAIGIVFPVYYFAIPRMVNKFLGKAKFEADYIFAIGTYGIMPGAAMLNLQKQARENGYRFDYANHLLMADNFLPISEAGKQIKSLPKKKIEERASKIASDINNRRHMQAKASPVSRAVTPVVSAMIPDGKNAQKYILNNQCNKCGICAKACPSGNITVTDKVCFADKCEACFACLHLCPQNALHHKSQKSDKRWRNPEVSLAEIIEANSRIA